MKNTTVVRGLIKCPVEEVFGFVSDLKNLPKWVGSIKSVEGGEASAKVCVDLLGKQVSATLTVTSLERNQRFSYETADPFPSKWSYEFSPVLSGATAVVIQHEADLGDFFGADSQAAVDRSTEASLRELKNVLEARRAGRTRVESEGLINAPLDQVFKFVADLRNLPRWVGPIKSVEEESDSGAGQKGTVNALVLDREVVASFEVVGFEPGERFAYETSEPFASKWSFSFSTALGDQTAVAIEHEFDTGEFFGADAKDGLAAAHHRSLDDLRATLERM